MRNDAFLYYNVPGWEALGLAIANFGDDTGTQNATILYLTQVIGRNMQEIMFHPDARLRVPPSINTVTRIAKLCVRARAILSARSVGPATPNLESAHAVPANEQFLVFPVPYFTVRNMWLKEYCGLALYALTEAFQHQENARPIEISTAFGGLVGQYFQRIYRTMGIELLGVDATKFNDPTYTMGDDVFKTYDPNKFVTNTEMIDTVPKEYDIPTEDDLTVLTNGIPVNQLPPLGRYLGYAATPSTDAAVTAAGSAGTTSGPGSAAFIAPPGP